MTHDEQRTTQVLIAGAGPAGLTAAIALARQGVDTLVVDRKRELSSLPRATVISTRSMELLRSWGLEQDILAGAIDVEWRMWSCESLALASAGQGVPVGLPTREQSAVVSPAAPECVPQDHTRARAAASTRVRSARSAWNSAPRWPASRAARTAPRVVLRAAAGGASRRRPGPLSDRRRRGAQHRPERSSASPCTGPDRLMHAVIRALPRSALGRRRRHRYGIYDIGHPEAPGALLPAGRGDRWIYGVRWEPGARQLEEFTEERFTAPDPRSPPASPTCSRRSCASAASPSPRSWRSASAAAARSSSATPRTACPRAAARG